jgi:hypothetical protein
MSIRDIISKNVEVASGNPDQFAASVSLLLNGDGTNGSQTFTDLSPTPKTITRTGSIIVSTAQKKYGTGSMYNNDQLSYLTISSPNNDFSVSSNFTLECWIYPTQASQSYGCIFNNTVSTNTNSSYGQITVEMNGSSILCHFNGSNNSILNLGTVNANTWYHIAITKSSNNVYGFINGVLKSSNTISISVNAGSVARIFRYYTNSNNYAFLGYIDDFRFTKGVARYTANFTPPTAPLSL